VAEGRRRRRRLMGKQEGGEGIPLSTRLQKKEECSFQSCTKRAA
jgi:hypothetical protein